LVLVLVALLGLQLLSRWIPPLQSPDELSHLVRIASLTEGQWVPVTQPGSSTGGSFDLGLAALVRAYAPIIKDREAQVPEEDRLVVKSQGWTGQTVYGEAPGSAAVLPVVYAPAALGLALGRAWDWTIWESYQLARFVSHLFCVTMMAVAVWLWRPPLLAWAVLLTPMSLFQMSSPVVDGPAHALTLLTLSLLMRLRAHPSGLLAIGAAAAVAMLVMVRLHLLPLLILPLLWGRKWSRVALASMVTCALWVVWVLTTVVDDRVQRPLSTGGVALHYVTHPAELWGVISRTFSDGERLRFLADSFIGNLGWLDTRLPDEAYGLLWMGMGLMILMSLPWRTGLGDTGRDRLVMVMCAGTAVAIAFALMLLTWSPFPTEKIEGVQGRYFIAPALVLAYALGTWTDRAAVGGEGPGWNRIWDALRGVALVAFGAASLWHLLSTLQARYPAWAVGGLWG
jgi:uncharacterized membrane protein